jgi:hypothetical protein
MKKRLAYYSSNPTPTGYYSRQYYGALPYPSPAGYPRSCAPFGSYVDMNATPRTISQIEADYGIGDTDVALTDVEIGAVAARVHELIRPDLLRLAQYMGGGNNTVFNATSLPGLVPGVNVNNLDPAALDAVSSAIAAKLGTGAAGSVTRTDVVNILNATKLHSEG